MGFGHQRLGKIRNGIFRNGPPVLQLVNVLLQDAASVVATEAERVAQGSAHGALLGLVEGEVEVVVNVLVAVVLFVVDGGRNDVVLYGEAAEECFHSTGSAEQVTCHTLCGADVEFVCVLAEELGDGLYF